jgi:hypothetical protein
MRGEASIAIGAGSGGRTTGSLVRDVPGGLFRGQ